MFFGLVLADGWLQVQRNEGMVEGECEKRQEQEAFDGYRVMFHLINAQLSPRIGWPHRRPPWVTP